MFHEQQMVLDFMEKHNLPVNAPITSQAPHTLRYLDRELSALSVVALVSAQDSNDDPALVRLHLILEESAELCRAVLREDDVLTADAIGDLLYVTLGAANAFGIPIAAVFNEIHKSNMTKAVRDQKDTRLRNKGASYVPPDIKGTLERGVGTD